ncbi:sterol desaturase family protein [Chryseobacterium oranimense]|jgi:sterol desaturase/sphingolipid hydroxylase (fatty acid hydroxylase superfamily)|uniref:sterol desaturase family protein n=1 Tax=Chryseobacterium oranimense TaxID=421058 RepID=UPI0022361DD1|nr:sterol desaturase family protein [Chryseobacterium oranimense]
MNLINEFSYIILFDIVKYFIIAGSFYMICYIFYRKSLNRAKIQKKEVLATDIRREIINSVAASFIMSLLVFIILDTKLAKFTKLYTNIDDCSIWWLPLSVLLGAIIHDSYFYWLHRLLHHKRLFKYSHVIHHQSKNPSPFASYSFNFIEAIGEGLIIPVLLFIVPFHLMSLYCFIVLGFIINAYGHLGYELAPKWFRTSFLFHILNTSVYHNLHHSKFYGNFGLYFRFWDKIMGTENPDYTKVFDKIQNERFNNK